MTDHEQLLFGKFTEALKSLPIPNIDKPMYDAITNSIISLRNKNRLVVKLYDKLNIKEDVEKYKYIYGYYSPFSNIMVIFLRKENFGKKFFGFVTDYDSLNKEMIEELTSTFLHEIMHYIATNSYSGYIRIWDKEFKPFMWNVIQNIIHQAFEIYYEGNDLTYNQLLKHPDLWKAFNIYYTCVTNAIKQRWLSYERIYSFSVEPLYKKVDFYIARLFDNILTRTINLLNSQDGYDSSDIPIYLAIKRTYAQRYKEISNDMGRVLFGQEMFSPTEISSYLSAYWRISPHINKLVISSLNLI